jgi:hypothetical protein
MAKDILDLCSLGLETGNQVRDAVRNSGFPDAAHSVIDNIGSIVGKVVTMATGDKELGANVTSIYKASASVVHAGAYFAKGEAGLNDGLQALAGGLGEVAGLVGDKEVKEGLIIAANGLANAGHGYKIGDSLAKGDTKGVVDGLTAAAKSNLSNVMKLDTLAKSEGLSEEEKKKLKEAQGKKQKNIEEIIDWSSLGLKTVSNTYDAVKQRDIAGSVDAILEGIGGALGGVLKRSGVPADTADVVANSYAAAIKVPKVTACLIKNPPDRSGALTALGEGFEKAFAAAFADNKDLKRVGASLAALFAASGKGIDMKEAYDEGNYDKVVEALEKLTQGAVAKVFEVKKKETTEGMQGKEKTQQEKEVDKEMQQALKGLATPETVTEALSILKEVAPSEVAANARQQEEAEALQMMEASTKELDEMKRLLQQGGEAGLSAAEASSIDKLIAQMVKDRMIIDLAAKISQGGTALAAKFCPALEIANAAVTMAANIYAAAIRAQELNKWMNNKKDFERAQSALTSASQNFVHNQAEQFSHYSIQAAFDAVRIIGEVASCSGLATAAGQALSKSALAASEAEKLLYDFARKEELERAWKLTCKAFNNPQNRKLALQVRAMNPTLAKYTIAWGAMVANDPLAKNAVSSCGLNETTLSHQDSNVDKVVQYMEVYFRDDQTLYREIELDGDWLPKDIELTTRSWSAIKVRAGENIKLKNTETGKLDGLLSKLARLQKAAGAEDVDAMVKNMDAPQLATLADVFQQIQSEFDSFKPDCSYDGKKVMEGVVRVLSRKAQDGLGKANQRMTELTAA